MELRRTAVQSHTDRSMRHTKPVVPVTLRPRVRAAVASASDGGHGDNAQGGMLSRAFAAFAAGLGSNNTTPSSSNTSQGPSKPRGAASSADAGARSKRQASTDMLHRLSATAHPSVIAAALVDSRDKTFPKNEFPPSAMASIQGVFGRTTSAVATKATAQGKAAASGQAYAAQNGQQPNNKGSGTTVVSKKGGAYGGPGGDPGKNGSGKRDNTAVISAAELDNMLSGLRASLESIQESRSKYVKLLAERETTILELQAQLAHKSKQVSDLDAQLRETRAQLNAAQAAAAAAKAEAAAATQAALEAAEAAATAVAAVAAAQAPVAAAAAAAQMAAQQQQQQQVAVAETVRSPSPPPAPQLKPAPPKEVTLYYRTNWKQAYVHCTMDGKPWTTQPGIPMEHSGDVWTVRLPCSRIEFVFTDGKGQWDSPSGNYRIGSPGNYRVDRGRVDEV